jgi:type VI secretion system secreted protein Hcp
MTVNIHIKIDTIPGMSIVAGYEDQIQVVSFGWGMSQTTNFSVGPGGAAGKVNVKDLRFTHLVDKATPKLMAACSNGQHIASAVLTCNKAGGDATVPFLKITLTDVLVSNVAPSGTQTDETVLEEVSLAFAEYKVEYQEQDNKGAKKGGPVISGFNIQTNKKTA